MFRSSSNNYESQPLETKYSKIIKLTIAMMSTLKNDRPDCGEILEIVNLCAVNPEVVKSLINLELFNKLSVEKLSIENSFHEYFIQKKLRLK